VGLALLVSPTAHAQNRPKVEVFGGISYSLVRLGEDNLKAKGWHAMVTLNSSQSWLSFVADFSSHRGSLGGATTSTYVAMAGMRGAIQSGRVIGFGHSMYGISFGHPPLFPNAELKPDQRVWFTYVPIGGGTEIELGRRIALRVVQFDLILHSKTPDYVQGLPQEYLSKPQIRLSCGIVFRFGKV